MTSARTATIMVIGRHWHQVDRGEESPVATKKPNKFVIILAVLLHAGFVGVTWRDLNGRSPDQIRGPKIMWRFVSGANTAGALAYWIVGRRPR